MTLRLASVEIDGGDHSPIFGLDGDPVGQSNALPATSALSIHDLELHPPALVLRDENTGAPLASSSDTPRQSSWRAGPASPWAPDKGSITVERSYVSRDPSLQALVCVDSSARGCHERGELGF
jgi:hypothetical protein